jgi:condensation domain-containing protein
VPVTDLERRLATLTPEQRAAVEESLRRRRRSSEALQAIPRRAESGPVPLSFPQQRIWFLEQWEPGGFTHNGTRAFRLTGRLDGASLERALERIVERHEVLRTVYRLDGREPRQIVLDDWTVDLPVVDLTACPEERREEELARRLRELAREPFDLTSDVLLRATLFRLAPDEHVFLVRLHHIAFDAFSDRVFLSELGALYSAFTEGTEAGLPELPIQYADFALWQREHLSGARLEELIGHWRRELAGAPPFLPLPIDGERRSPQRHEGRHRPVVLPGSLQPAIAELGRSVGATSYMTLLSAFAVLLYRITGQDDVVIGTPIANRGRTELEPLIGFFSNTVAMRIRMAGNPTFREVVRSARETAVGAYAHQELPFERVVEELQVERDARYNPVFQVNFRAQTEPRRRLELTGIGAEPVSIDIGFSRFDLALELQVEGDRIGGYIEYDLDLFEDATIDALAAELESLLEQVTRDPDRSILELKVEPRWRRAAAPRTHASIRRSRDT